MTSRLSDKTDGVETTKLQKNVERVKQAAFSVFVLGLFWEFVVRIGIVNSLVLPPPSAILAEVYVLSFEKHALLYHVCSSFYRLIAGYIAAVVFGFICGTLLGVWKTLREMFSPILSFLISIPTIAWVPVLLITMGLGDETVITAIFLGGVFEIIYSTIVGIRSVSKQHINAARIMGANGLSLFLKVFLPGSLVYVMPALRLSVGYCWRALVGAEMLSAMIQWGLGKMIYEARFWNDVKVMFVGLMLIGLFGFIIDRLFLRRLERETTEKWGMVVEV